MEFPLIRRKVFSTFGRKVSVESLTLGKENLNRRELRRILQRFKKAAKLRDDSIVANVEARLQ